MNTKSLLGALALAFVLFSLPAAAQSVPACSCDYCYSEEGMVAQDCMDGGTHTHCHVWIDGNCAQDDPWEYFSVFTLEPAPASSVGTTSSGIWRFVSRESCFDLFGSACTETFPQPQCPPDPEGKTCSPLRSNCYDTISPSAVDVYRCMSF